MAASQIINMITRFLHNHLNLSVMFVYITLSKVELDLVMFDIVNTNVWLSDLSHGVAACRRAPGPEGKQVYVFKASDSSQQHLHKGLIVTNIVLLEGVWRSAARPAETQIKWDSRHEGSDVYVCVCVSDRSDGVQRHDPSPRAHLPLSVRIAGESRLNLSPVQINNPKWHSRRRSTWSFPLWVSCSQSPSLWASVKEPPGWFWSWSWMAGRDLRL